jgi:alkanesulfonate monooxygenase SsuD/methylene tetrahydromethanopterin reductase-like flavin-dependent oxidoreductase (luciferase family)
MNYDIFFSISQTPVQGHTPTEKEMFQNFFQQVEAADELGFGVAWVAESHLSSEVQKQNNHPVIPHWQGEVGLNVDIFQLAHQIFQRTTSIEVGSAVMNILCNGGPMAAAERCASFATLHGLQDEQKRKLHVGFSAGRFDFMNRAYGLVPRNATEQAMGPALKGKIFAEAVEVFLRLLRGDILESANVEPQRINRQTFRSDDHWLAVQRAAKTDTEEITLEPRYQFEKIKIVPQSWRRELIQPVIGSHDPQQQIAANSISPVQVFNLSITQPEIIEDTHRRMQKHYHPDGGAWKRSYMPRTTFVFLNEEDGLQPQSRSEAAKAEAQQALGAYWTALEGTLDPNKVNRAATNALIGNADDIATQICDRFHPQDRLMLWFDFFNHDSERVIRNMRHFMHKVVPLIEEKRDK